MVGGPQIGYFYPGLTYEIDMHAGDLQWRGATSAPFPGYVLIGRGEDFAHTLTSASGDIIDQYAETLCDGSDTKYLYKGQCLEMGSFDAGTLNGEPVSFRTTVHGPVVGYATVKGVRVAISQKRSSYGRDTLDLLFNRRLSNGQVQQRQVVHEGRLADAADVQLVLHRQEEHRRVHGRPPADPRRGRRPGPADDRHRQVRVDGVPLQAGPHPGRRPRRTGRSRTGTRRQREGFAAADDTWGTQGSVARVDLLDKNLARLADKKGKWTLASVTAAMNAAATQDVRAIDTVPLLKKLLKGSKAPNAVSQQMLALLVAWKNNGGSRLDRDLDGKIDDPGAAIMDVAWPKIADAFMAPRLGPQLDELDSLFGRFDLPPSGQYSGWYQYFDRDIRSLLGMKVKQPFENAYCGAGKLEELPERRSGTAIAAAGAELTARRAATRRPGARTRCASGSSSPPACCRRRCATPTARAGSSR